MLMLRIWSLAVQIGILIDCVKEELRLENVKRNASADTVLNAEVSQSASFWNPSVLELVEIVLRPPEGGPPCLPEDSDAVNLSLLYACLF